MRCNKCKKKKKKLQNKKILINYLILKECFDIKTFSFQQKGILNTFFNLYRYYVSQFEKTKVQIPAHYIADYRILNPLEVAHSRVHGK